MMLSSSQIMPNLGEPYLRLQLDNQNQAVLPMKYVQQVLVLPSQRLTSMPNMPPHIIGLVSKRNRIYWLIDLPGLLGLNSQIKNVREYNIAFIEIDNFFVGLAVKKIKGINRVSSEQIQFSLELISKKILPYINGYIIEKEKLIYVLNPLNIINKK